MTTTASRGRLNYIIKTALLSAVAFVLMYLEIPIGIVPPWLELDFSDLPAILAGFALGPVSGVIVQAVKVLLFLLVKGSTSGFIGELGNFLMGVAVVLPSALYYMRHKTRKGAVIAMVLGILTMTVVSGLVNYFLLIPAYTKLMPIEAIIDICTAIVPAADSVLGYCLIFAMPFTFVKATIDCVIIFIIYKRIAWLLHRQY